jgi:hypothetical protein
MVSGGSGRAWATRVRTGESGDGADRLASLAGLAALAGNSRTSAFALLFVVARRRGFAGGGSPTAAPVGRGLGLSCAAMINTGDSAGGAERLAGLAALAGNSRTSAFALLFVVARRCGAERSCPEDACCLAPITHPIIDANSVSLPSRLPWTPPPALDLGSEHYSINYSRRVENDQKASSTTTIPPTLPAGSVVRLASRKLHRTALILQMFYSNAAAHQCTNLC